MIMIITIIRDGRLFYSNLIVKRRRVAATGSPCSPERAAAARFDFHTRVVTSSSRVLSTGREHTRKPRPSAKRRSIRPADDDRDTLSRSALVDAVTHARVTGLEGSGNDKTNRVAAASWVLLSIPYWDGRRRIWLFYLFFFRPVNRVVARSTGSADSTDAAPSSEGSDFAVTRARPRGPSRGDIRI